MKLGSEDLLIWLENFSSSNLSTSNDVETITWKQNLHPNLLIELKKFLISFYVSIFLISLSRNINVNSKRLRINFWRISTNFMNQLYRRNRIHRGNYHHHQHHLHHHRHHRQQHNRFVRFSNKLNGATIFGSNHWNI